MCLKGRCLCKALVPIVLPLPAGTFAAQQARCCVGEKQLFDICGAFGGGYFWCKQLLFVLANKTAFKYFAFVNCNTISTVLSMLFSYIAFNLI